MASNRYATIRTTISRPQLRLRMAGVFILFIFCLVVVVPAYANRGIDWINNKANLGLPRLPAAGFNLGLDLQGGAHLIYRADSEQIADKDRADAVEGVRDVIERRVRGGLGVAEPLVQTTRVGSEYRIIVELPGVTDVNQAIKMIGETPVLEFKEENNEPPRELTAEEQQELDSFNAQAEKKIKEALAELKKGADFGALAVKYSEDERSKNNGGSLGFINSDFYPEIYRWAQEHKENEISPAAIESFDGLNVLKRLGEREGGKQVSTAHLLICYKGAQGCDNPQYTKKEARVKIEEIREKATTENFTELVKEYSTEPGAAGRGGDLGSFRQGQMVPEFEKVAFEMPVNSISGVVETKFGYHLIYKKGEETSKEYEVMRIYARTKSKAEIVPPVEPWKGSGLSGKQLKRAEVTEDFNTGQIQVSLNFDEAGTKLFSDITSRNVGKPVAIFLDGQPVSIPRVNEPILSGSAVITGGFTLTEAKLLAQRLNSGALPVPVELISQQKVDATLGAASLTKSVKAGLLGLVMVMIFMLIYYRLPGFLAVLSLALYTALSLAVFKLIGVTLTLSGIAGFILSTGMAVDANVLIFERLKEELRGGKSLKTAAEESFIRAWTSIRDSNITTLISCVFLIWFGSGFVQGFAVTLAIGVLVSMLTAITITRTIMRLVLAWFKEEGNIFFLGFKHKT